MFSKKVISGSAEQRVKKIVHTSIQVCCCCCCCFDTHGLPCMFVIALVFSNIFVEGVSCFVCLLFLFVLLLF